MKKAFITLYFALLSVAVVFGQSAVETVSVASKRIAKEYKLNDAQKTKLEVILTRKENNLKQIESLKSADPSLYQSKYNKVLHYTNESIKKMLNPSQMEVFKKKEEAYSVIRNKKMQELKNKKSSAAEYDLVRKSEFEQ